MNINFPFEIKHINLSNQPVIPNLDINNKGNYILYWWNDIPLGDIYINPNEDINYNSFSIQLCAALKLSLEHYSTRANASMPENWQQWIIEKQIDKFRIWMKELLSAVSIENIPNSVPVSVIICTRNRPDQLFQCLTLLQNLACLPEEIIVIDNAPDDNATQEIVKKFDKIKYVKEPRIGLNIARNTGIQNATLPIIAYVDDDVIVHPLWVYRIYEAFLNPNIAATTGLVIAAKLETKAQLIFEQYWSFNRGYIDKIFDSKFFDSTLTSGPPVWKIGAGANMAFRKDIFSKVGYFDEILDVGAAGCNGDSEMWYRILLNGHTISYNPRAVVYHEHRNKMDGLHNQIFYYMRGFTVAALLQHEQYKKTGYKRHIFYVLPRRYLVRFKNGILDTKIKDTSWIEFKGIMSGIAYYYRNRSKSNRLMKNE